MYCVTHLSLAETKTTAISQSRKLPWGQDFQEQNRTLEFSFQEEVDIQNSQAKLKIPVFKFCFATCNDSSDSFLGDIIYSKYSSVFIKVYGKISITLKQKPK